jgi:hypothetical protein
MEKVDVIKICEMVLERLALMTYEKIDVKRKVNKSTRLELNRQLIFPQKIQGKELNQVDRISEQELRQLFIEEFKVTHPDLFYSIETPTAHKYSFTNKTNEIKVGDDNNKGKSASLDMCIFKETEEGCERILNVEFKHQNSAYKSLAKDVLKLVNEKQNGAFILLLKNTDSGTFRNNGETGVFDKFYKSFDGFGSYWEDENKFIQLVIISLNQKKLIHKKITKTDLSNLNIMFFVEKGCGNIDEIEGNGWGSIGIEDEPMLGMVVEEKTGL